MVRKETQTCSDIGQGEACILVARVQIGAIEAEIRIVQIDCDHAVDCMQSLPVALKPS